VVLQFTKKIIALFLTVCLLVTSLCVTPVLASNVVLYSYNGVIAPELPVSNYSYAFIYTTIEGNIMAWISGEGVAHPYVVSLSSGSGTGLYMPAPVAIYRYNPGVKVGSLGLHIRLV